MGVLRGGAWSTRPKKAPRKPLADLAGLPEPPSILVTEARQSLGQTTSTEGLSNNDQPLTDYIGSLSISARDRNGRRAEPRQKQRQGYESSENNFRFMEQADEPQDHNIPQNQSSEIGPQIMGKADDAQTQDQNVTTQDINGHKRYRQRYEPSEYEPSDEDQLQYQEFTTQDTSGRDRLNTMQSNGSGSGGYRSRASSVTEAPPVLSEENKQKWWPKIEIWQEGRNSHITLNCRAVCDTGNEAGNFVSARLVKELRATKTRMGESREFTSVAGDFTIEYRTNLAFSFKDGNKTYREQFWIAPSTSPFDILLCLQFIATERIVDANHDEVLGVREKPKTKTEVRTEMNAQAARDADLQAEEAARKQARKKIEAQKKVDAQKKKGESLR